MQSLPRIVSQVVILGSQILGKAFVEAYKQAARSKPLSRIDLSMLIDFFFFLKTDLDFDL